jgi:hypothetical protein
MTLDQYLEQFIEGYLFEDLRSMAPIQLPSGKRFGAVGYPMVMTALSGIEVLGLLTSRAPFTLNNGAASFRDFWRGYMYEREEFQRLDELIYEFVRHGLAHSFMTKPKVVVTKHRDQNHLRRLQPGNELLVDALTLHDDLEAAYFQRLKPKIEGSFKAIMEERLQKFRAAYQHDHQTKRNLLAKAPMGVLIVEEQDATTNTNSPSVQVSSPSGQVSAYSTTTTTKPTK